MTERSWRFVFGILCLIFLTFEYYNAIYVIVAIAVFEGITNLRLPIILSKLSFMNKNSHFMIQDTMAIKPANRKTIAFEAQRMFRLSVAIAIAIPLLLYPETLWFLPWFTGIMLTMSGITGICPMMLLLQWAGFKSTT